MSKSLRESNAFHRQGQWEALYDTPVEINWCLTDMCNYQCSYCFGQEKLDKKRFSTKQQLKNAVQNIAALNRPWYDIVLSGGEPTTHPNFFYLIEELYRVLNDRINFIMIITNGSQQGELYNQLASMARYININIMLSVHTDHVDLCHIEEIAELLCADIHMHFSLMYNPEKFDYVKKIHASFCSLRDSIPFYYSISTLREPPRFDVIDSRYADEHFSWQDIATKEFDLIANSSSVQPRWRSAYPATPFWEMSGDDGTLHLLAVPTHNQQLRQGFLNFQNMYCTLGTRIIAVDQDGSCMGARCGLARKNSRNIYDENFQLDHDFINMIKCTVENCGCATNHPIPKFSSEAEAEQFVRVFRMKQQKLTKKFIENNI